MHGANESNHPIVRHRIAIEGGDVEDEKDESWTESLKCWGYFSNNRYSFTAATLISNL